MRKSWLAFFLLILLTACSSDSDQSTISPSATPEPVITQTAIPEPTEMPTATNEPQATGVYIDADLPGETPQRFGETFFNGSFHSAPVFSPDGKTVWWAGSYGSATIYTSQMQSGVWSEPEITSFSESIDTYRDPFISPDGTKFYFISTEIAPGLSSKENLWMMEKEGESWGEPYPLPISINDLALHWTVSVTTDYDLYFSAREDENTDIYISHFIDGAYTEPVRLDAPVNTEQMEITPNIAPDETYLLFTRVADNSSEPYLFITFALDSGWSEPVKVENVSYCISPIITPDRAYVIFMSSPSSFAWRDTSFIEELRP